MLGVFTTLLAISAYSPCLNNKYSKSFSNVQKSSFNVNKLQTKAKNIKFTNKYTNTKKKSIKKPTTIKKKKYPTRYPTKKKTKHPTPYPTKFPTEHPTPYPTKFPTEHPTSYSHYSNCLQWGCEEWCKFYDETLESKYISYGCIDDGYACICD